MKKIRFFSVVIVVIMAVFVSSLWAGQKTYYFSPALQGVFGNTSTIYQSNSLVNTFTGPPTSTIDSIVVEGKFGANCIVVTRTFEVLNSSQIVIGSGLFNDGKFKLKILIPSGYPANSTLYFRFKAQRSPPLTNPCAASINPGTGKATIYYTP